MNTGQAEALPESLESAGDAGAAGRGARDPRRDRPRGAGGPGAAAGITVLGTADPLAPGMHPLARRVDGASAAGSGTPAAGALRDRKIGPDRRAGHPAATGRPAGGRGGGIRRPLAWVSGRSARAGFTGAEPLCGSKAAPGPGIEGTERPSRFQSGALVGFRKG